MTMQESYELYLKRQEKQKADPLGKLWYHQEDRYVHPFKLYGNVWFVGESWVSVHLIDTGDGLLLIDSGNCGGAAMLIQAIWEAGFNPADVKWILHSHGHLDHFGASNFMKRMFGTKLYLSEPDAKMFKEHPELALVQEASDCMDELFEPDGIIHDGETLTFGNTEMEFYMVPGHTEGCFACFFDIHNGDEVKRAGYYGGFGFNTLQKDYLIEIGDTDYNMRKVYLESLKKVRDQKVEIFLGNHTDNNKTLEKREFMLQNPDAPNPFIDDKAWGIFLDGKRDELLKFMADPKNN